MRAVIATEPGGAQTLQTVDRPEPEPADDELLVRVAAAGVNRADVAQRQGRYPPPPGASDVLGLEVSGTVEACGTHTPGWKPGDQVCAILTGGGYAEFVRVPAAVAMPVPPGVDLVDAGAIPEVFTTAYDALFLRGELREGQRVLIHGGSSGVGTAAIQLAVRAGAEVFVTASSVAKLEACRDLGASVTIDYTQQDFVEEVAAHTDGTGVDVVLDMVGGPYLARNLEATAVEGRLVVIAVSGGATAELHLGRLMVRRQRIIACTLRARSVEAKADLARRLVSDVWPAFADGTLKPVVDRMFALDDAASAHTLMESSAHIGKILLLPRT